MIAPDMTPALAPATNTAVEAATTAKRARPWLHSIFCIACILMLLAYRLAGTIPFGFAYDPQREHCLTNFHLGFAVIHHPKDIQRGQLVMFAPVPALAYVKLPYILKQVAAVPGDHVVVKNGVVSVNGREVVHGLALSSVYGRTPAQFERDEVVQAGHLFVVGDHERSDDSRYWGYLDSANVTGTVYRLF